MKQYYIYSHKWTSGNCRKFWRPNEAGYTTNLDEAGIYDQEHFENNHLMIPLIESYQDLTKYVNDNKHNWDTFYVEVDKVFDVLGKKITCVQW